MAQSKPIKINGKLKPIQELPKLSHYDNLADNVRKWYLKNVAASVLCIGITAHTLKEQYDNNPSLAYLGGAASVAGVLLGYKQVTDFRKKFRKNPLTNQLERAKLVEADGNELVRHPMYSAYGLVHIGMMLMFPSFLNLTAQIGNLVLLDLTATNEEKALQKVYGDQYKKYKEKTPKYIPPLSKVQDRVNSYLIQHPKLENLVNLFK
ncbi:MAG TPA: isoprenylcysteine carboxylmethyltransferase family protein [Candidatus Nanoarchaeia archaeon]|nr:isoprenylcysteine carboxylmethyltransferase family protein [Candidatus Nanoarchaeia archaeon]